MRRVMHAACFQMGPPHFMLTLTPSSSANGLVANIAATDEEKKEYFQWVLNEIPGVAALTAKIQELGSKDPVACAQYFSEILEFTLKVILGFDADKHSSKPGLYGELEWYGGGVENQGSHLLHGHLCCRVRNWPKWLTNLRTAAVETSTMGRSVGRVEMLDDDEEEEGLGGAMAEAPDTEIQQTEGASQNELEGADVEEVRTVDKVSGLTLEQMAALVNFGTTATFPVFELFKGVNSEGAPTVICPSCANPLVPEKLSIFTLVAVWNRHP